MANCVNYNCFDDPLDRYHENECGEEMPGGSCSFILLECNSLLTDPSSAAQINVELAARRATLITGAYISLEAPTPVMSTTVVACRTPRVVNYDRAGTYKNENVSADMVNFHTPIFAGRTFGGMIIHEYGTRETRTPQITWINRPITFTGGRIIPGAVTENQRFEGQFKYTGISDDDIYTVPAGIF